MLTNIISYIRNRKLVKAKKNGLIVGKGTRILGNPSFGSEPYLIRIGERCTITSGVRFITHDGGTWVFRSEEEYKNVKKYGRIKIGNNCFVGINTIIMPNVTIGDNCVIGAGSIVTKSIPNNSVAVGSPARVIMSIEEYKVRCKENATPINISGPEKKNALIKHFWGAEK